METFLSREEKFIKASHAKKLLYETLIYLRGVKAVKKNSNAASPDDKRDAIGPDA